MVVISFQNYRMRGEVEDSYMTLHITNDFEMTKHTLENIRINLKIHRSLIEKMLLLQSTCLRFSQPATVPC